MQCTSCGFENEQGAQFCEECGSKLVPACPGCGREVRPTAKFCSKCGTSLTAVAVAVPQGASPLSPATPALPLPARRAAEAERRQLTVMFCDLVGSTALSAQLDPEEYRQVVQRYQDTCTAVIRRYEGQIAQHLGDGLLVYFGYPSAHEDDAVRAVRTGLAIIEALKGQGAVNGGQGLRDPLQVRIGIHTGLVVIGEIGGSEKREILALGETPNLAARVQGVAEPDTVVMSAVTQRLVQGLFECQDLGPQPLKGIATPLGLYQVTAESVAQSRFEVAIRTGLTPFIGRDAELAVLRQCWEQASAGHGQVVLLNGEPGIGKSRLVQELKEQVGHDGVIRVEFRCSPYYQNSTLYPIIDHLQRLLQFAREDTPAVKLEKLRRTLSHYRFPQAETLPLLAALLSLPHPEGAPPITLSPQKQKQKTQEAFVAWIVEEADKAAVYCVWEDLHWADPSTIEVLTLFLDQVPTTRLLAVLTFRPEFIPPWGNRSHLSQLMLHRLDRPHVETMVEQVTRGKALPLEVFQQIVSKTDGVPLFVEELTKTVVESGLVRDEGNRYVGAHGSRPIPPLAIPSTLQDSLMARLDRLTPVKELAQLGATLGREFSYELLHAVSPLDENSLQQGLRQLVEAELLYQRGLPPQATYFFKHAFIQETAYQSLLKSKRQQLHQQIARVLEGQFPDATETQPELVARHYTEAGLAEQAIPYWQKAGQSAIQRSANLEALSHLTKALELLKTLVDTPERVQQELALQIALGTALMATQGYAAPEVERVYARARELCQRVGESRPLLQVLLALGTYYQIRAELQTARALGKQCLSLAQRMHDPVRLLQSHFALGAISFHLGEFVPAREHLEQGLTFSTVRERRSYRALHDPVVGCLSYSALVLWSLGYPEQALKRAQEALILAQEMSHPFSLAVALNWTAWLHHYRREGQLTRERAEAEITLSNEQGFPVWAAFGMVLRGWALAEQERGEEGIAQIRQGITAYLTIGGETGRPHFLALLAEACGKQGQAEEGLKVVTEALTSSHKNEDGYYEAELYRLKGELLLQQGNRQEAEACFLKVIGIARHQQAKSFELRASTSLARLWQQQGKTTEAHQVLSDIYHWFTEGFDTKDLQEAKALLVALDRK
jgi:class 3 adenylate cyclase/predicted ATPase